MREGVRVLRSGAVRSGAMRCDAAVRGAARFDIQVQVMYGAVPCGVVGEGEDGICRYVR